MSRDFVGSGAQCVYRTIPFSDLSAFTIACWVMSDGTQPTNSRIFQAGTDDGTNAPFRGVGLGANAAGTTVQLVDSGIAWRGSGFALSTGVWTHVAVTRTGSGNYLLYKDASQIESVSAGPNAINGSDNLSFGGHVPLAAGSFNGAVAECAAWNVALSVAEIAALAKGVSPLSVRPSGILRYVPVWGAGSPEPDMAVGGSWTLNGSASQRDHAPVGPPIAPL